MNTPFYLFLLSTASPLYLSQNSSSSTSLSLINEKTFFLSKRDIIPSSQHSQEVTKGLSD